MMMFFCAALLFFSGLGYSQEGKKVVFMGDSITQQWERLHPEFFTDNGFVCKGISGQTTPQMLIRFRKDVVDLGASTVVILAGTNDIAGNTGKTTPEEILSNIKSMCDIAKSNNIDVVLCSVLPANKYSWTDDANPAVEIPILNSLIKEYADSKGILYIDYFTPLVDNSPENKNGLLSHLTTDGVHLNPQGYDVLEGIFFNKIK